MYEVFVSRNVNTIRVVVAGGIEANDFIFSQTNIIENNNRCRRYHRFDFIPL